MQKKKLVVATEVQKAVFLGVLLPEIQNGFWKNARPADHGEQWNDVEIVVGAELGPIAFDVPRNYNFVNPDFFSGAEAKLLECAQGVNPDITVKQLKKQLITMNQILGSRITAVGGEVTKLARGRKQADGDAAPTVAKSTKANVKRAAINFVEPESTAAQVETSDAGVAEAV